ncbi:Noc2p family-domain-containing protein [Blastocladiella britannica]|nr:Noc2p family-domain-containing protein [Blastocladiella britannica]
MARRPSAAASKAPPAKNATAAKPAAARAATGRPAAPAPAPAAKKSAVGSMSLDEFLAAAPAANDEADHDDGDDAMDLDGEISENDYELADGSDDDSDADEDVMDLADDDDDEEEEEIAADTQASKPTSKAAKHQAELERLKDSQPEFYQFLLENDQSLLEFDDSDVELEGDEQDADASKFIKEEAPAKTILSKEVLAEWEADMERALTPNNIKRIVVAFRSAVQGEKDSVSLGYTISSASVHRKVIILALKHVPAYLSSQVSPTGNPTSSPKWKRVSAMAKVFFTNAIKLLKDLTDFTMVEYVLQELHSAARFVLCFPKVAKDYFRLLLSTWGAPGTPDVLRVKAFAHVRYLAETYPKKYLEPALKGSYMMTVKAGKRTTVHTLPTMTLMIRCGAEMYGLDAAHGYQYAFIYIRQLAIHLRNAMAAKTKESYKMVYQWQYVHSLRFWTNVLLSYAPRGSPSPFGSLVYPLVQVLLGVLRLVPNALYAPLHLHLLGSLTELVRVCGVYVPLAPYFIGMLDSLPTDGGRKSTLKPLYLPTYLRCPKQYAGTRVYVSSVRNGIYLVLLRYLSSIANNVAFPELVVPVVAGVKAHLKSVAKDAAWTKTIQGLLDKVHETRKFITARRQQADLAPCDSAAVYKFAASLELEDTPIGKFAAGVERVEAKRMAMMQESFVRDYDASGGDMDEDGASKDRSSKKGRGGRDSDDDEEDVHDDSDDAMDVDEDDDSPKSKKHQKKSKAPKVKPARRSATEDDEDDDFLSELKSVGKVVEDDMGEDSD